MRDRGAGETGPRVRFTSRILPPYLRRAKSIEELLPWLYLKGISTGDFCEALAALLGPEAPGLSASTIARLKEVWQGELEHWQRRDLSAKRYVCFWADGVYFSPRLDHDKQCMCVIIGADELGRKELLAIADGYRESAQSWREVLLDLKRRGLAIAPELATGDGALGFWKALREVYGTTREQRCWVHKTANVLNKLSRADGTFTVQLTRMPLDLGDDAAGFVPGRGLIAEAGMIPANIIGRPADGAFQQMGDAALQHLVCGEPDGVAEVLGFDKLVDFG